MWNDTASQWENAESYFRTALGLSLIHIFPGGFSYTLYFSGKLPVILAAGVLPVSYTHLKASFCVVDQDKIVPEKFTTHYRSAIAFGRIRVAEDPEEILTGLRALGEKYSPGRDTELEEEIRKELAAVAVLVLTVEHLTGKQAIELVPQPGDAPANEKL